MKKYIIGILVLGILAFLAYWGTIMYKFAEGVNKDGARLKLWRLEQQVQEGDIIFQTSRSSQSQAIQQATHSRYSHLGIIYKNADQYYVYEAIGPVKLTPLEEWVSRGEKGHYVVKRLKNAEQLLKNATLDRMRQIGEQFKGKPYDIYFEWTDERFYCSELVWKIYKEGAGVEIGQLQSLSSFDLSHELVQTKMKERYGNAIPLNEKVISPAAMFRSERLVKVVSSPY